MEFGRELWASVPIAYLKQDQLWLVDLLSTELLFHFTEPFKNKHLKASQGYYDYPCVQGE